MQRQLIHQYLAKHYETWPATPLPALGGKSPLEAVKDKRLRPAVIELSNPLTSLRRAESIRPGENRLTLPFFGSDWD
jgi:hypothetical protein